MFNYISSFRCWSNKQKYLIKKCPFFLFQRLHLQSFSILIEKKKQTFNSKFVKIYFFKRMVTQDAKIFIFFFQFEEAPAGKKNYLLDLKPLQLNQRRSLLSIYLNIEIKSKNIHRILQTKTSNFQF